MKCSSCQREIALAKRCPYCGELQPRSHNDGGKTERDQDPTGQHQHKEPRGEFKGRVGDSKGDFRAEGPHTYQTPTFLKVLQYLFDGNIPVWRKWVVYVAIFYILSPIDILPGFIFGPFGWMDDLLVLLTAWRWLKHEIRSY